MIKNIHSKLFFIFLLLLPSQLNYYFWPLEASILGRRVDYLAPSIYFLDLLMIIFLFVWSFNQRERWKIHIKRNLFPLLLLGILILVNCFISERPFIAFYHWLMWIKIGSLGLYIYKNHYQQRVFTLFCLLLGILWASTLGNLQFLTGGSLGGLFYYVGERSFSLDTPNIAKAVFCPVNVTSHICMTTIRAYGTFPHPNVLSGYIVFILLLLLKNKETLQRFVLLKANSVFNKWLQLTQQHIQICWWVLISYLTLSLVLTFSRTAGVALLVGILWLSEKISPRTKQIITMFTVLGIIFTTLPYYSFHSGIELAESFFTRQQLNTAALSIIANNAPLGVGLSHFLVSLPLYFNSRAVYFLQPVHNIYLLILSEIGIVGTVWLFTSLLMIIRKVHITIIPAILVPFLLIGLSDHYLLTLHHGRLLTLFVLLFALLPTASLVRQEHK